MGLAPVILCICVLTVCWLIHGDAKKVSIAVFAQVGNVHKWSFMMECIRNVAEAKSLIETNKVAQLKAPAHRDLELALDIHVTYVQRTNQTLAKQTIEQSLKSLPATDNLYISTVSDVGLDVGQFLNQLSHAQQLKKRYDLALKIHSKSDKVWANHVSECLCGTPAQVMAIINQFTHQPELKMIAPRGMLFSARTPKSELHPLIRSMYFQTAPIMAAFAPKNVKNMKDLHTMIFSRPLELAVDKLLCVAGTMFWASYPSLYAKELSNVLPALSQKWTTSYVNDNGIEHALERLIPTWIRSDGGVIGEMGPAPKVVAMYFPQFHQIPENDRFHGKGFTEWTLLKPLKDYPMLQKPLDKSKGGLGYYDVTYYDVRAKQGMLARQSGVHAFCFYHYWFSGAQAPKHHLVMGNVPKWRIKDGMPNVKFMFSWANEPWTRTWSGEKDKKDKILLSQEYGDREDWVMHFNYLLPYFKNPNYIKVNRKPAFALYRIGLFGAKLPPILRLWNQMAKQHGFPGIHFINTIGNFLFRDTNTVGIWNSTKELEASFHFRPQIRDPYNQETEGSSVKDLPLPVKGTQYWGAFTNFDARPRRPNDQPARTDTTPDFFQYHLKKSFAAMSHYQTQFLSNNLYFITAWNEWNEQAVLEPSNKYGNGYLVALKTATETIPVRPFMVV